MHDDKLIATRVATRFAAIQLPSGPTLALLTKAAKGIKGGFTIEALEGAVVALGWSIKTQPVAVPLNGEQFGSIIHRSSGLPTKGWNGGQTKGEALYNLMTGEEAADLLPLIQKEVKEVGPSGPSDVEIGAVYVTGLGTGTHEWAQRSMLSATRAWLGMQGWTITTSKGDVTFTNKMSYTGRIEELKDSAPEKVWTFLYKSGLKEAATAFLASFGEDVVQNAIKPADPRKLIGTGTCPCCFMNVKMLRTQTIMRHGWAVHGNRQRGAYHNSWHSGPCFGVGYQPFELSPKGTEEFLAQVVKPALVGAKKNLARLKARPDVIRISTGKGLMDFKEIPKDTTVRRYTSNGYVSEYEYYLGLETSDAERQVSSIEEEIEALTHRIQHWKLLPLPGTAV